MKILHIAAIAAAALLSACDGGTSNQNGSQAAAQTGAPPIAIGQTGKAKGIEFTITSVEQSSQIAGGAGGPKAEAGETFVVVKYTLKNTASKPLTFMERPGLSLTDAAGQSYAIDDVAGIMATSMTKDMSAMTIDLNPGISTKPIAVWKVDKKAFDRSTWKVEAASDPTLTFSLK